MNKAIRLLSATYDSPVAMGIYIICMIAVINLQGAV